MAPDDWRCKKEESLSFIVAGAGRQGGQMEGRGRWRLHSMLSHNFIVTLPNSIINQGSLCVWLRRESTLM